VEERDWSAVVMGFGNAAIDTVERKGLVWEYLKKPGTFL
jgi:hypothetical protein